MRARSAGVVLAAILTAAAAPRAQQAAPAGAPTAGAVVLLANDPSPQASETLRRALVSSDRDVRRAAARVASVAHPEVFDALRQALDIEQDAHVLSEFVRDALALADSRGVALVEPAVRRGGAETTVAMAEWLARMQPDEFVRRLPEWGHLSDVVDRLQAIVALAVSRHPEQRDVILGIWHPFATEAGWQALSKPGARETVTMRTLPGLAAELLRDTFTAAGCTPTRDALGSVLVAFSKVGRPIKLDLDSIHRSAGCQKAFLALARVSLDPDDSGGLPQLFVVPMMPEFAACRSASGRDEMKAVRPASGMGAPQLKKEVKPNYTRRAMNEKIEGPTEMEATVSPAGCVTSVAVTRSLVPDLDLEAIRALLQWRFTPGTVDGHAVPVLITVELTLTLR